MTKRALLPLCLLALSLSACANRPEVRDLAAQTRAIAVRYNEETVDFAARQDALQRAAESRLRDEHLDREALRAETDQQRQAWRIDGDTRAERLFVEGSAVSAEAIAEAMRAAEPPVRPAPAGAPDLSAPMQAWAEIARAPSRGEQIRQGIDFLRAVADETETLRERAEKANQSAQPTS